MFPAARMILSAILLPGALALGACQSEDTGNTTIQMKDLEVVDGTATDAMTDLDGVQTEGAAVAIPAGNAANAAAQREAAPASNAAPADTEILSDQ